MRAYLAGRASLRRVFLLIDARHGLKPVDAEIMRLLDRAAVPFQVVLTKADKPTAPALEAVVAGVAQGLARAPGGVSRDRGHLRRDRPGPRGAARPR